MVKERKIKLASLKDASILRKFTILFILMSILPIGVLYYFYTQIGEFGRIEITENNFNIVLILIVLGVAIGYFTMRAVIKQLMDMAQTSTKTIQNILGADQIKDLDDENEIATLTRSFNLVIDRLKENVKNLELAKRTLHSVLSRVGSGIASMENIDSFLDLIVETVTESLDSDRGVLLLVDEEKKDLLVKSIQGASLDNKESYRMKTENGCFDTAIKARKPVVLNDLDDSELPDAIHQALFEAPLLCAPLFLHDKLSGIIVISKKTTGKPFDKDEYNLLNNIALQTAVAIENSKLNADAEKTYFETISALALAVEAKDKYSRGHLDRVSDYAIKIAKKLKLSEEDIAILRDASRLHDIGKIGIYDDVLRKPSKLTPEERKMIVKHTEIGESIIKPIRSLRPLCDIIRHHHECLDGSGYPDGLKGNQISLLTRILMVADIYDALTTDRPYRKRSNKKEAKQILLDMAQKVDVNVVNALFEAL